jgi:2-dehydro-3-deoxygluconokinase
VETGASQRPSTFLYNRKGSSITELRPGEINWNEIFKGKHWFHFTGITPALSESVAEITKEACVACKKNGVTISCDLNFRKKLWSVEKAREVMTGLMEYVDVLFTNEEEAETLFGIAGRETDVQGGRINTRGYENVAAQLLNKFGLNYVAISLRESLSATVNNWSGMLYDGSKFYTGRMYHMDYIVDRIGGGDAYSSGIIYGLLTGQDLQQTVEFATAASCLKHTIHGDFNLVTFDEILALMNGDASGRIQR